MSGDPVPAVLALRIPASLGGVGYLTDGESGATPAGCTAPCDAHIDLEIPVSLDSRDTATITIRHLYGDPCDWDCEALRDGKVGTTDLLVLLAQWARPGFCDFDGGGVSTTDLLKMLANWGPCP